MKCFLVSVVAILITTRPAASQNIQVEIRQLKTQDGTHELYYKIEVEGKGKVSQPPLKLANDVKIFRTSENKGEKPIQISLDMLKADLKASKGKGISARIRIMGDIIPDIITCPLTSPTH